MHYLNFYLIARWFAALMGHSISGQISVWLYLHSWLHSYRVIAPANSRLQLFAVKRCPETHNTLHDSLSSPPDSGGGSKMFLCYMSAFWNAPGCSPGGELIFALRFCRFAVDCTPPNKQSMFMETSVHSYAAVWMYIRCCKDETNLPNWCTKAGN